MANLTKSAIEQAANVVLVRGWILDGAGPARYGYAVQEPCRQRYVGRTLLSVAVSLGVRRVWTAGQYDRASYPVSQ